MNYTIVKEPIRKIKEIAKQSLKDNWLKMMGLYFVFFLLTDVISAGLDHFFSFRETVEVSGKIFNLALNYGSGLYQLIIYGPLALGLALAFLTFFRKKTVDTELVFEGFSDFGRSFVLFLLMSIKIFLWSLLFVIPGIIATFRYSQAFLLLADHKDWTPSQCIRQSCIIMKGNKGKLFGLLLSFILWAILCGLPAAIIQAFVPDTEIWNTALVLIEGFISIPLAVFIQESTIVFYELIVGNLLVVTEQVNTEKVNE